MASALPFQFLMRLPLRPYNKSLRRADINRDKTTFVVQPSSRPSNCMWETCFHFLFLSCSRRDQSQVMGFSQKGKKINKALALGTGSTVSYTRGFLPLKLSYLQSRERQGGALGLSPHLLQIRLFPTSITHPLTSSTCNLSPTFSCSSPHLTTPLYQPYWRPSLGDPQTRCCCLTLSPIPLFLQHSATLWQYFAHHVLSRVVASHQLLV